MLQQGLEELIGRKSEKLYRYKGVVAVQGYADKFVFQGVHMLCNSGFVTGARWGNEKRVSKFVFIGVELDRDELTALFEACKATPLRFAEGDKIYANCEGWHPGVIVAVWEDGNPYRILLHDGEDTEVL